MLKAGVANVNITPPVGVPMSGYAARKGLSQGVHDELYAKALVLDDDEQRIALVISDLLYLDEDFTESVRRLIEESTGISGQNVMVAVTHTHAGPVGSCLNLMYRLEDEAVVNRIKGMRSFVEDLRSVLERKIAGAVYIAAQNMVDAGIGVGKGLVHAVGTNRRDPRDPMDPEVGVIRIEDLESNVKAVLYNFTCHPTVLSAENLLFTADYPGYASRVIEETKKGVVALFTNGALGDISTRFTRREQTFREAERLGTILAAEVLKTLEQTETTDRVKVNAISKKVNLPFKELPSSEEAERMVKEAQQKLESLKKQGAPHGELRVAMTALEGAEMTLHFVKEGLLKGKKAVSEVQVLAANDTILVGVPGELFVEVGLEIKKKSGLEHAYIVGCANDSVGYILSPKAYEEALYETGATPFSQAAGQRILDTASELIRKVTTKK